MTSCLILLLFHGVDPFLRKPFDTTNFIVSYISVSGFPRLRNRLLIPQIPIFISLVVGYKIGKHGFHVSQWGPERSCDLSGAIQASEKRVGRLEFPDQGLWGLSFNNVVIFLRWIWVWMK
jgi:amino acid transporter